MSTGRAPLRPARAGIDVAARLLPSPAARHRTPWRCRVLRCHVWGRRSTEDGGRYAACVLCGTELGAAGLGPMTTPPYPGQR